MPKILAIAGLMINLGGALMLWRFVSPSPLKLMKGIAVTINTNTVSEALLKEPRHRKLTNIGLLLTAIGFLLQLIAVVASS